jgi:hypothetical protein
MTSPPPPAPNNPLPIPLGFGAQIKALQETQHHQALRIATLEQENTLLKTTSPSLSSLLARIEALEQQNAHLVARRKEAVTQLLNLRTLHQEANNAFAVRAVDIEADDLEGVLGLYGTSMTTVLNQHQRALGQMRAQWQGGGAAAGGWPVGYAYPVGYGQMGYCLAHQVAYPCRACGK